MQSHRHIRHGIAGLIEHLKHEPRTSLDTLLAGAKERLRIVVTFLALLEMTKLGLIRIWQETEHGDILVWAKNPDELAPSEGFKDDYA